MTDVRRAEEPVGRPDERLLYADRRRAPDVGELVVVVAVAPEHHELLADEERGRAVARLLGDTGQGEADLAYPALDVAHRDELSTRNTGWLGAIALISSSVDVALTPSKNTPTSAFHRRR